MMLLILTLKFVILTIIVGYVLTDGIFSFDKPSKDQVYGSNEIVCPNNRTKCKETQTCCATKHNSYHCCRYSNAICCPDKYHCCPSGTTCNAAKKGCTHNAEEPMEWPVVKIEENLPVKMLDLKPSTLQGFESDSEALQFNKDITCPNNKTQCKDTKTCCITKHGNYYCCPHKNAVCCSDKYNCCPENTKCDLKNKKCIDSTEIFNSNENFELKPAKLYTFHSLLNVDKLEKKCPNSDKQCPGEKKCCQMTNGKFGCCTFNKGVCCPDMETCCPHNTECDSANKKCVTQPSKLTPFSNEMKRGTQTKSNNICPDKRVECESSQTCCSVGDGLYGCCPFKNATCCSDNASCCPHDKVCDLENKVCKKKEISQTPIIESKSLIRFYSEIGLKVICPDLTKCEKDFTCCPMEENKYGCCSIKNGVCCEDKKTCCSYGYKCVSGGCSKAT